MTPEVGILVGTVVLIGLTAVLVAYTPFGRDVRRHASAAGTGAWKTVSNASARLLKGRQIFWTGLLVVVAMWLLALASRANDLLTRHVGNVEIGLLAGAGLASAAALLVAYMRRTEEPRLREEVGSVAAANQEEAKAKQVKDLRRQIYAKAVVMHKYALANPGPSFSGDQVQTLNSLIYKLLGQGDDLTAFVVPTAWITAGPIDHDRLGTLMEGLIIYLKDVKE
jgi:hypothetical protein